MAVQQECQSYPRWWLVALIMVVAAAGCSSVGTETAPTADDPLLVLSRVDFSEVPGWPAADPLTDDLMQAFRRSCDRFSFQPDDRRIGGANIPATIGDFREICAEAAQASAADPAAVRRFFETGFVPFLAGHGTGDVGLFTGYYEPLLRGSLTRTGTYGYPLYRRPPDLVSVDLGQFRVSLEGERIAGRIEDGRLVPYATREEIDHGALAGKGLEILWVDDPIAAFFLHVQGSGRVQLSGGRYLRVGYAGQNGHIYASIGRELVRRGELTLDEASLQGIRAWIQASPPDQAWDLFAHNPSYIFFRVLEGPGPIGSQGVPLTPRRSLAVDRQFVPLGVPIWLDLPDPDEPDGRLRRMMIAQDTGGAIKGPVRGDLFWGFGPEAEWRAGRMKAHGRYFILLPKRIASRMISSD